MRKALICLVLLLCAPNAWGAIYYVRTDGNDGNDGLSNAAGGAWLTIDHAADTVSAGDTIRVQAGTYAERVTPGVDGTSGNLITFVADGLVTMCGFDLTNNDYLRIIGFTMDTETGACEINNACVNLSGTNTYLEFWNNTLQNATYNGIRTGAGVAINNSLIVGNTFTSFGIGNYSGVAVQIRGSNNLVAHNTIYHVDPDAFTMIGTYNRWINNYTYDILEEGAGHPDIFQTGSSNEGWSYNLVESHFQVGSATSANEHTAQISHGQAGNCTGDCGVMTENIFRRNVMHDVSQATVGINQVTVAGITYSRFYNNTTAGASRSSADSYSGLAWAGTLVDYGYLLNNIEYMSWGDNRTTSVSVYCLGTDSGCLGDINYSVDYNLGYRPSTTITFAAPFSTQANGQANVDPGFVDYANNNFTITNTGGAYQNAGPLTTVSSENGTGTEFTVADAGFFRGDNTNLSQYSGALVVGDTITVGTDVLTISGISSNTITVTSSFTWAQNDPVYYGGTATPDIGAYPYKAGGYDLTGTWSKAGDTVTVTPNDSSLVRWVVVFENGVPVGVANAAPWQVAGVGSGTVTAKMYALYASQTPVREASQQGTHHGQSRTGGRIN